MPTLRLRAVPVARFDRRRTVQGVVLAAAEIALSTAVVAALQQVVSVHALAALYVLAVLPIATGWGLWPALAVAVVSTFTFNFVFIPPLFVLTPMDAETVAILVISVVIAIVVSELAGRAQRRTREAESLARDVRRFAEEQSALRRVATLVARGVAPEETFSSVAAEVGRLFGADVAVVLRFEPQRTATVVGSWTVPGVVYPEGARLTVEGVGAAVTVLESSRPTRAERFEGPPGSVADSFTQVGARAGVGAPISVQGRLWGAVIAAATERERLPIGSEESIAGFTELVATAIANADSQAQLSESRARIVATSDNTRRRIERDLHDGAQQRLVSLALQLHSARVAAPPEARELKAQLDRAAAELTDALDELREIARGVHPAAVANGGLRPALKALARRSAVPVRLDIGVEGRLPEQFEIAAYYVVSEALTNAAKHAHASLVHVEVNAADDVLRVRVGDDGRGGAQLMGGSGLVGLKDRVEALGGRLAVQTAPGAGTTVHVELPLSPARQPSGWPGAEK